MRRTSLSASTFVFLFVLATSLAVGRTRFLNDPGTFWHMRLGRDILASGAVPRVDTLTVSRQGTPWVDQSWLFDLGLAWVVERGGWSLAVVLTALLLAALYAMLAAWVERLGHRPFVAAAVAIIAASAGSIHFLTRPHMFTFYGVFACLVIGRRFHDRGGRCLWILPPLVALWANLHGGFVAGPLIVLTWALGEALARHWAKAFAFLAAAVGSALAALINPYGFRLYEHVTQLLFGSGVTAWIQEYQPARFGRLDAWMLEGIVLGLIALPLVARRRPSRFDAIHALVWLHLGLASVRNVPLFAIVSAPMLAAWVSGALLAFEQRANHRRKPRVARPTTPTLSHKWAGEKIWSGSVRRNGTGWAAASSIPTSAVPRSAPTLGCDSSAHPAPPASGVSGPLPPGSGRFERGGNGFHVASRTRSVDHPLPTLPRQGGGKDTGAPATRSARTPTFRAQSIVIPAATAVALIAGALSGWTVGGPSPRVWPLAGLAALDRQPVDAPLFHEQDWGGLIAGASRTGRLAWIDDRFELWGVSGVRAYVEALQGGPGWDDLLRREPFALVWLRPGRGLARRLEHDPAWRILHRDAVSILFGRAPGR
jgi:hypothetical protein